MDNHGECSKPKKSKSSEITAHQSQWAYLPSILLYEIFDLLDSEDRINASVVCKHWRNTLFHPNWWSSMKFTIEAPSLLQPDTIQKARFLANTLGPIVENATVALDSLSTPCIYEFISLLSVLNKNNHLKSLVLEPSHCRLQDCTLIGESNESTTVAEAVDLILAIVPRLHQFSLGGLEDLSKYTDYIVKMLNPSKVTLLGLASIKDDLVSHEECYFSPELISAFTNLQVLSIDYDQLSDKFLYQLEAVRKLERLVVHLDAIPSWHEGTSNKTWADFRVAHPGCTLRLTVIHAYNDVKRLHVDVLREEMPLSHLKVFFCECVNIDVLHFLSSNYARTLRSVMWIDSLSDEPYSLQFLQLEDARSPNPFVLMTWRCHGFEELVLYGYQYLLQDLLAIGRLRGSKMTNVEIPEVNIVTNEHYYNKATDALEDISVNLGAAWNPVQDLHPVILNPDMGDSDEFLLPLVLADLH
ncbi:F-box only protein 33 isoform X2 [Anthonomus grandis grandis]|nr:F-box only protein 33 isoform X2 [Anthonomus grandis grandis]